MSLFTHAEAVARRKLAPLPQHWSVCRWEKLERDCLMIHGGVMQPLLLWPGRAGKLLEGEMQSVMVRLDEARAEALRFEADTGKCGECLGSGHTPAPKGKKLLSTPRREACPRCAGSKLAPATSSPSLVFALP